LCTESKKIGCFLSVCQSYIIFWVGFDYLFEARFKFRCFLFSVYHDNWWFLTTSSVAQGPRNSFFSGGGWVSLIFLTLFINKLKKIWEYITSFFPIADFWQVYLGLLINLYFLLRYYHVLFTEIFVCTFFN